MNHLIKKQVGYATCLPVIVLLALAAGSVINNGQQAAAQEPLIVRIPGSQDVPGTLDVKELQRRLATARSLRISGTSLDDRIFTSYGNDWIYAAGGNDFVSAGWGNDVIHGQGGHDKLFGGAGNDRLYGDGGDDSLDGGPGDDVIKGEQGNDLIQGNSGNDKLYSRWGNDFLTGGAGNDVFIIRPSGSHEYNVLRDFTPGVDQVDLTHPGIHVADFAELLTLATQKSQGVEIRLPTNNLVHDRLFLFGLRIADLDHKDFPGLSLNVSP